MNLLRLSPSAYLNRVYAWCIERVDPDKLDEWQNDLIDLLPWQDSTSQAAVDLESDSFMAMMGKGGG